MKKGSNIFLFLSLLLAGYCCQIGRFCTAFQQINNSHTYEKGLTKRVLALRSGASYSLAVKKAVSLKRELPSSNNPFFIFCSDFSLAIAFDKNVIPACLPHADYLSPLFSSGKRGPPALI